MLPPLTCLPSLRLDELLLAVPVLACFEETVLLSPAPPITDANVVELLAVAVEVVAVAVIVEDQDPVFALLRLVEEIVGGVVEIVKLLFGVDSTPFTTLFT